jgi:hypothetical protein
MRISLKHLLLGMSLGAVVVSFYGFIKLSPQTETAQVQEKTLVDINNVNFPVENISQVNEPEIANLLNRNIQPQVQFIEVNRYKHDLLSFDIGTPTPTPIPSATPQTARQNQTAPNQTGENTSIQITNAQEEIITLIEKYAGEYGVDRNMMVGIAKCESGFRSNAVNGPYAGIYQFVSGTWISNRRAMGLDENLDLRFNAEEAVRTAAFKMSRDGFGAWPVCQHKAKGLIATSQD